MKDFLIRTITIFVDSYKIHRIKLFLLFICSWKTAHLPSFRNSSLKPVHHVRNIRPPSEVFHLIARHCSLARFLTLLVSISTRGWLARVSRGSSSCLRLSTYRRKTLSRMGKLGGRSPPPRLPVLCLHNEETWTATWTRFFSSSSSFIVEKKKTRVEVSLATSKDKILEDSLLVSLRLSFVF